MNSTKSSIVTCACGAKVRVPADSLGQTFRCPKCRTEFVAAADQVVTLRTAGGAADQGDCPICQSAIEGGAVVLACPSCGQTHHRQCWAEVGGCSTYGCPQAPGVSKEETAAAPPRSAWGDTKACPACGETIKAIAVKCRYCGTAFDTVDPLTATDLRRRVHTQENLQGQRTGVIVLFVVSLIGCLAPLVLLFALAWFLPQRRSLAKAGPFYLGLGYSALAVSVLYCVLMVLFLMLSGR